MLYLHLLFHLFDAFLWHLWPLLQLTLTFGTHSCLHLHSTHCFALRTCHKSKSTYSAKVSKLLQNKQSNSRQHQRQRQPPEQFVPRVSRWLVGECAKYISATTGTATDADDATRTIKSTPFAVAHLLLNNWRALRPPTSDPCPTFEPS